jgi:predicted DNA-binding protein (UPF0251 family)
MKRKRFRRRRPRLVVVGNVRNGVALDEQPFIGLALVEAHQAAGLTQAEVAKRLGVSQAQVAHIVKRA